jgi:hypothetical protein
MVAVVDEAQTREYIKTLEGFVRKGLQLLERARRWPWRRHDVPRLLHETAHNLIVLGINQYVIGEITQGRSSFVRATTLSIERLRNVEGIYLGYQDIQVVGASVIAAGWTEVETLANLGLSQSVGSHQSGPVVGSNAGARAVLKWVMRKSADVIQAEREVAGSGGMTQFKLLAEAAWCGTRSDVSGLQKAIESLTDFTKREVRSGDFRYSEDRLAYLPGVLVLLLAERDDLPVVPPADPFWDLRHFRRTSS